MRRVVLHEPASFTFEERTPYTNAARGWVAATSGLDVVDYNLLLLSEIAAESEHRMTDDALKKV